MGRIRIMRASFCISVLSSFLSSQLLALVVPSPSPSTLCRAAGNALAAHRVFGEPAVGSAQRLRHHGHRESQLCDYRAASAAAITLAVLQPLFPSDNGAAADARRAPFLIRWSVESWHPVRDDSRIRHSRKVWGYAQLTLQNGPARRCASEALLRSLYY